MGFVNVAGIADEIQQRWAEEKTNLRKNNLLQDFNRQFLKICLN